MDDVDRIELVSQARGEAINHLLLGLVGAAVAAWIWQDWLGFIGYFLVGFRGIFAFLAAAAAVYELAVGIQFYQKANRLDEVAVGLSTGRSVRPDLCRSCSRPLMPGQDSCTICGEPATPL